MSEDDAVLGQLALPQPHARDLCLSHDGSVLDVGGGASAQADLVLSEEASLPLLVGPVMPLPQLTWQLCLGSLSLARAQHRWGSCNVCRQLRASHFRHSLR